jgi:hypothetical protein
MKKVDVVQKVRYAARSAASWERLLLRWTGAVHSPEARLVCFVIASAIAERLGGKEKYDNSRFFEGDGFSNYCRIVGLDPAFVSEQISRSADFMNEVDLEMMDATDQEATAWMKRISGVDRKELAPE